MSSRLSQGHTELSKYADLKLILKLSRECGYTQSATNLEHGFKQGNTRDYLVRQDDTKIILPAPTLVSD